MKYRLRVLNGELLQVMCEWQQGKKTTRQGVVLQYNGREDEAVVEGIARARAKADNVRLGVRNVADILGSTK